MSFPSVAEAGLLRAPGCWAPWGHLPGTDRGQQCPGMGSPAPPWQHLHRELCSLLGLMGFFLPCLSWALTGSLLHPCYSSPPCLFLGFSLCICFLHPLLSAQDATGTNRRREGGTAQWEGENFSCCSLVPLLHGLLRT